MAEMGEIVNNLLPAGKEATFAMVWIVLIILLVVGMLGISWWLLFKRARWNLKVEIKLLRSDGKMTIGEWGRGFYNPTRGVVMIKRPGRFSKPIPMKIFDVKKYMQGSDLLTVIQVSAEDYRPILNSSYSKHFITVNDETKPLKDEEGNPIVDSNTGKQLYETKEIEEYTMDIKTETGKNKAWRTAWEEAAKNAYTISSFLRQYSAPISIGIVVICCFVGFAILWTKLSSVC